MTAHEGAERLAAALADRYHIERELGQGGMATVYLARDLRHDRDVAIKVLRPELAAVIGAERFLREIKTIANLQHPHILGLIDSGDVGGTAYYVMPFVEGESLRDRLTREKQLPVPEAVRIASEVASALDYAHRRGVIHRDIKPENILLHDGQALVADFGIALAASRSAGTDRITGTGISLGTPAYMAPEQAMGEKDLTPRVDIYSLSCVLYEMLAGAPPFQGGSVQAIVAKVLTERAPDLSAERETVPRYIAAAVRKGLARLPADRFMTAAAFAQALTDPMAASGELTAWAEGTPDDRHRGRWTTVGLAGALAIALMLAAWGWLRARAAQPVMRFRVALPEGEGIALKSGPAIDLSPDGSRLVYVASSGPHSQLRVWRTDNLTTDSLAGTAGALEPTFSPDGRAVAFWLGGTIRAVALAGGPSLTLNDSASFLGISWGPDGFVYYARAAAHPGISRVPAAGGTPEAITTVDTIRGETEHRWPSVLPNGRGMLFTAWRGTTDQGAEIAVVDLRSRRVRILFPGVFARYVAPGRIVVARRDRTLYSVPFDQGSLTASGREAPLLKDVNVKFGGATDLSIAGNGTLAYLTGDRPVEALVWVGRDGTEQRLDSLPQGDFTSLALSPNGSRIAMSYATDLGEQLWMYDLAERSLSRLTFDGTHNRRPEWSPDGSEITYASDRSGRLTLWRIPADGGAAPLRVLPASDGDLAQEASWSHDAAWLVYRRGPGGSGSRDLMAIRFDRDSEVHTLLDSPSSESSPQLSPEGRWLAYVSDESGRPEVYVRRFPANDAVWQVSVDGGIDPVWSHSGNELFYRQADGVMMSAGIRRAPAFGIADRRRLFSALPYAADNGHALYGVSPDDQRFLMVKVLKGVPGETDLGIAGQQLVVVLNWVQDLKRGSAR